jgi:putative ABC transport system permease protein
MTLPTPRAVCYAAPGSLPRLDDIRLDWRVVAFTALVTLATGIAVGLVPGLRASRDDSGQGLKEGGRLTSGQRVAPGARRALVIAELTLAAVTLSGTGMLVRSLWNLESAELGFEPRNVLTARIAPPVREYDPARALVFYEQLLTLLRALPGVATAGASGWLPVIDAGGLWGAEPDNHKYPEGQRPQVVPQWATPGYFRAMGLPLLAGREITSSDRLGTTPVVIVSKRLADQFWPNENPIGRRLGIGNPRVPWLTVIGVVGDISSRGFGDPPEPTMYFAYAQSSMTAYYQPGNLSLVVRTTGNPASVAGPIRSIVHALDRDIPVSDVRTMDQIVGVSVANRRFSTMLLAGFALLALLLAGIGTYGVISYGVTQRSVEIGVRIALGAGDRSVLTLVMREGMRMCAIGIALGLIGSAAIGRGLRALLVGVSPLDARALLAASLALVIVALLACVIPARRALTVDPISVMRAG